jgi:uncharacterized membrane protein
MKTARYELPRIHQKPPKPAPIWIDVNADCQSIVVNAPAAEVYRRCLRFEDFPRFITSITKIDKINHTGFSCMSMVKGQEMRAEVKIMMRVADRRIAWQAVSDHFRAGVVFLDPLHGDRTKVTVKVRSITEPVMLTGALHRYLQHFKQYVENDVAGD